MLSFLYQVPRHIRRNFAFDLSAGVSFGLFFGGVNSFLLVQAIRLGATPFEVGLLAALPNIWMLLSPLWAKMFEHKSPFLGVFMADGISRFCLFFLIFHKSVHWYLLIFAFHYFFSSISVTIYGKAMRQAYPPGIRGTLMGWVRVGSSLAQMLSTAFAGFILPLWGVQYLFAFMAVFGICSSIAFSRIKPVLTESVSVRTEKKKTVSALTVFFTDPNFRRYMIALFLFGLANIMTLPAHPLYQVDVLKVSDKFISLFWLIISFASLVFYFMGGRFIDRYSPVKLTLFVFLANLGIPVIYILTGNQWPLLIIALCQGIVNAGIDLAALNSVLHMAEEDKVNSYMAVHISLLGIRGTIGPLIAPVLIQFSSFKIFFGLILILNLMGVWWLLSLLKKLAKVDKYENLLLGGIK